MILLLRLKLKLELRLEVEISNSLKACYNKLENLSLINKIIKLLILL